MSAKGSSTTGVCRAAAVFGGTGLGGAGLLLDTPLLGKVEAPKGSPGNPEVKPLPDEEHKKKLSKSSPPENGSVLAKGSTGLF